MPKPTDHAQRPATRLAPRLALGAIAATLLLGAMAAPATAQTQSVRPPAPGRTDDPPIIRTWILVGLLAAGCVGAACIPSKRGHQD